MAHGGKRMFCRCSRGKRAEVRGSEDPEMGESPLRALRAVGWTSVALGVTALGLYIGRELRLRYKISHRTPSGLYSHAGEELGTEYGMGI